LASRSSPPAAAAPPPQQQAALEPGAPVAELVFADNSVSLAATELGKLAEIASIQRQRGGNLRVVGHAPPGRGSAAAQIGAFSLALDRANAVATALADAGVPSSSILVEAAPPAAGVEGRRTAIYLEN
jgi:outer membrane protein OmpA-like peptidoglycan-associated protein